MIAIVLLSLLFLSGAGGLFFLILYLRERSAAKAKNAEQALYSEEDPEVDMARPGARLPENEKE